MKEFASSTQFEDRLEYYFSSPSMLRPFFEVIKYLISHEDFIDLFQKYGVFGNDISSPKEYGLISGAGRHEIFVEKGESSVFQNDNLVLAFTIDSDKRITFEYSALALIEILEIETDDEFFQGLADNFKECSAGIDVIVEVYSWRI